MHEMSIALEVCRIVEEQVGRDALFRVREVAVEVGRRSGVEPDNLEFCLEALLSRPPFAGARPLLILRPGDDLRVRHLEVDDPDDADDADGSDGPAPWAGVGTPGSPARDRALEETSPWSGAGGEQR